MSYTRYKKLQKWVSNDNGINWVATDEYKKGEALGEFDSLLECEDSGQDPNLQRGYRWINLPISDDWECFNGSKYYKQQRQYTTDKGQTWHDMDEYRMGTLFEMNASDCQNEEPQPPTPPFPPIDPVHEWITYSINEKHDCVGFDAYYVEYEVESKDNGTTWTVTGNERRGALYESNSELCGYVPPIQPALKDYSFVYSTNNTTLDANDKFKLTGSFDTKTHTVNYNETDALVTMTLEGVITSMRAFAYGINNLTHLRLAGVWDMSKVTTMTEAFAYLNLQELTLNQTVGGFDTSNISTFNKMLYSTQIDGNLDLSFFKMTNASNIRQMLSYMQKTGSMNLNGWNLSNLRYAEQLFYGCTKLQTLHLRGWSIPEKAVVTDMFKDCPITYIECSQSFKDWCYANQSEISLANIDKIYWDIKN